MLWVKSLSNMLHPIAVCDNYWIRRANLYHGEDFRGYLASKKRYFCGLRIHILVTEQGEPVEFFLEPGACSDIRALALHNFDLPQGEDFRGYLASKKRYFYGLRIHILVTEQGEPVEFFLEPGACSDIRALALHNFDLPQGSFVTGDKPYNDCTIEDTMCEAGIELIPRCKKNSLQPVPAFMTYSKPVSVKSLRPLAV